VLGKVQASVASPSGPSSPRVHELLQKMYGEGVVKKQTATEMRNHGLSAIEELSRLLNIAMDSCAPEQYEQIRRGVGLSIGRIQLEVLDVIYAAYPELDHLKKTGQ
jgi:hypothetical protein